MKIIKEINNCQDCDYCHHNGLIQEKPKYICHNDNVKGRNKVPAKYWYNMPILGAVNSKNGKFIEIPDWCPLLEDSNENA